MLFSHNIEPCCAYCRHGTDIGGDEVACIKRGIIASSGYCSKFRYEPTKRVPHKSGGLKTSGLSPEDFAL